MTKDKNLLEALYRGFVVFAFCFVISLLLNFGMKTNKEVFSIFITAFGIGCGNFLYNVIKFRMEK